jgi:hypothetical protein
MKTNREEVKVMMEAWLEKNEGQSTEFRNQEEGVSRNNGVPPGRDGRQSKTDRGRRGAM